MTTPQTLGERLRTLRIAAGFTLDRLSETTGVSARGLSDIERGVSASPQARTLSLIADGLALEGRSRDVFLRAGRSRTSSQFGSQRASAIAPHRVADFTGREREIVELQDLLSQDPEETSARVIIVSGPAGIGKTTIALEALSRATRGESRALFADLDGHSPTPLTPLDVMRALLRQLPNIGDAVPANLIEASEIWRGATSSNPVSVILDNASHEAQVRSVLAIDSRSVVVITSRRSLAGLDGVRRLQLGPLGVDDSIALLARLIPVAQFEAGNLRELASLCDHVPLALRIAGNRIASRPAWTTRDFLVRLRKAENRLRLLVAGDLAVEAAFALSYDDLEPDTAALFRAISVIEGSTFDARLAASTMNADVLTTEEHLDELIDLGLVEARGGSRYRLHDLIRLYASQCLRREDGVAGVLQTQEQLRHWVLRSLERAGAWFEPDRSPETSNVGGASFPDAQVAEAWIRLEEPHWWTAMQAAAAVGEDAIVADVADSLHWFSEVWIEWGHWCDFFGLSATASRSLGDSRLEAMHLGYLAWSILLETSDFDEAVEVASRAVVAANDSGDHTQMGWANFYVAMAHGFLKNSDAGIAACAIAISEFEIAGDTDGVNQAFITMSRALTSKGDSEAAVVELERIIARSIATKATTHPLVQLITELNARETLSVALLALGRNAEVIECTTESLQLAARFDSAARTATSLRYRAQAYIGSGNLGLARDDLETAIALLAPYSDDTYSNREVAAIGELQANLPPE